jgi:hypothetical protein
LNNLCGEIAMRTTFRSLNAKVGIIEIGMAIGALAMVGLGGGKAVAAEVKGYAWVCSETKQICTWHKAVVAPPKGWAEDEAWTQRYKSVVMFPNGDKSRSKPVMYVRAHAGEKDLGIDTYISVAQERWKKKVTGSTIEPLPDVARAGKPTFKVFLYKNPSQPEQTFELTAFMKDTDNAHPEQPYFFQVVLSSPNKVQLDNAKAAFYDVLGRL